MARRYDQAARYYDRLADVTFEWLLDVERYREQLIAMLGNIRGARVLDIGCGTGRSFPQLVSAIGPHGRLLGVDCSSGMLAQAARRVSAAGWRNVELVRDDAFELATITQPVDALVSAWCYGEVTPLEPALKRALAVIRSGGRFAVMSFAQPRPTRGPLRWLYPLCRVVARTVGVHAESLDSHKVAEKWLGAVSLLRDELDELRVECYANEALLAISGRKR